MTRHNVRTGRPPLPVVPAAAIAAPDLVGGNDAPEAHAPDVKSRFSVVTRADGSCFIRAVGFHAQTVVIGLFADELLARAWLGVLQSTDQITSREY